MLYFVDFAAECNLKLLLLTLEIDFAADTAPRVQGGAREAAVLGSGVMHDIQEVG